MKKSIILLAFVLASVIANNTIMAQSFTISVTPAIVNVVQGNPITLNVTGLPTGGYNASIQMSMVNSCFNSTDVVFTPVYMNAPYNGQIQINNSAAYFPGVYDLVVKGANGSVMSYDTIQINLQQNIADEWFHLNSNKFTPYAVGGVRDVEVDSQNNYWFTTSYLGVGGICKYSGQGVEAWRSNNYYRYDLCGNLLSTNVSNAIQTNSVGASCIEIDSQDNIWFMDNTYKNINQISSTGALLYQSSSCGTIPGNGIVDFEVLDYSLKKMYFSTNGGLLYFDGTNFTTYTQSNSPLPSNNCKDIEVDSFGAVWITTDAGLAKLQNGFWTIYNSSNSALVNNDLWYINSSQPLATYFSSNNAFYKIINNTITQIYSGYVKSIQIDSLGNIWGLEGAGMIKIDTNLSATTWSQATLNYSTTYPFTLNSLQIDRNGSIIVGAENSWQYFGDLMIQKEWQPRATGIKNNNISKATQDLVYPNPSENAVKIFFANGGDTHVLQLTDATGRVISTNRTNQATYLLEKNTLTPGVYFLRVSNSNAETTVQKIIFY